MTATGQRFVAARVRCTGFEADVCLPADEQTMAPAPGSVVAGTMVLVASLPNLRLPQDTAAKRSWLRRKR